MQVTLERLPKSRAKLTIELPAEIFEEAMSKAYPKVRAKVSVPGFRKGKAPRKVIENLYGESVFYEDAFNGLYYDAYEAALKEQDLTPVGRPEFDVEQIGGGQPLIFIAEVDYRPEVTIASLDGIEAVLPVYPVEEADITAEIDKARERVATYEDVERPIENGDKVKFDFSGSVDGELFDGGSDTDYTLEIGSGRFIPGFEEQMVGMVVNEERDLPVTFPEEYHAEQLAGKEAVFHVTIKGIQCKVLPEVDDEFAKDVSEFETLEAYRADIAKRLTDERAKRADDEYENALIEQLTMRTTVEVPQSLIEMNMNEKLQMQAYRFQMQGLQLEQFLAYTGQSVEEYREQFRERAEFEVLAQLAVAQLEKDLAIEADEEGIEKEISARAERRGQPADEYKASLTETDLEYIRDEVKAMKVIEYLKAKAVAPAAQEGTE